MKKVFAIFSALLIMSGLKAQKSNAQKETVKPPVDSLVRKGAVTGVAGSKSQKDAKPAPATQKETPALKYAPAAQKEAPALQKGAPATQKGAPATTSKAGAQH